MIGKQYFVRQAAILFEMAKATTDPRISAALLDKAANLKSQLDEPIIDRSARRGHFNHQIRHTVDSLLCYNVQMGIQDDNDIRFKRVFRSQFHSNWGREYSPKSSKFNMNEQVVSKPHCN